MTLLAFRLLAWPLALLFPEPARTLIPYQLEDQFRRVHIRADHLRRPVLVVAGDRHGSAYGERSVWAFVHALERIDSARVEVVGVADLRGIPRLLRGFVRGKFARSTHEPVLLDWDGIFATAYALPPELCTMLLVDTTGTIVGRLSGTVPDSAQVAALAMQAHALLSGEPALPRP